MDRTLRSLIGCAAALALIVGCGGTTTTETEQPAGSGVAASVRNIEKMTVASVTHLGPVSELPVAMGGLTTWAASAGLQPAGAPFGVFHGSPETPTDSVQFEACMPVPAGTVADSASGIAVKEFGGFTFAAMTHVGPYESLQPAYDSLAVWIDNNGYVITGPAVEFYLSDPQTVPAESTRTEIGFEVRHLKQLEREQ